MIQYVAEQQNVQVIGSDILTPHPIFSHHLRR